MVPDFQRVSLTPKNGGKVPCNHIKLRELNKIIKQLLSSRLVSEYVICCV